jgi:outer membrane beta-barrel protein
MGDSEWVCPVLGAAVTIAFDHWTMVFATACSPTTKSEPRFRMPRSGELNLNYVYYAKRNVPQGHQRSRSSLDVAAKWPVLNERAELLFTFTDIFNDFAIEQEIDGQGFRALCQNLLETQVATVGLRFRF